MDILHTDRLLLRPWRDSDAEALYRYASDPEVGPLAGWAPHSCVEESLEIIRTLFRSDHIWAIEWRATGEPIGCIGYYTHTESNIGIGADEAEAGYWVARPYWNQGIATEALREVTEYCFGVKGFRTLWADCFPHNVASRRVMEKCGFVDTGRVNRLSHLQIGGDKEVRIMRLDRKDEHGK